MKYLDINLASLPSTLKFGCLFLVIDCLFPCKLWRFFSVLHMSSILDHVIDILTVIL